MIFAFLLAQVAIPTPPHITVTATPAAVSERTVLSTGLDEAAKRAKRLGATLGAVIIDLGNGASVQLNADLALPMQSVQKLPIGVLVYQAIEKGKLRPDQVVHVEPGDLEHFASSVADNYAKRTDYTIAELTTGMIEQSDNSAVNTLTRVLGGLEAANASLRAQGYFGILLGEHDSGYAKPAELATFLADLQNGKLLHGASQTAVLGMMANASTYPGRLRAGFPKGTLVEHKTGTSGQTDGVTDATNDIGIVNVGGRTFIVVALLHSAVGNEGMRDAVLAAVGRAAYEAARQFPI